MIAETARTGDLADERVAVALYAIVGALLCTAWLVFFAYLARHPDLTHDEVDELFFARERPAPSSGSSCTSPQERPEFSCTRWWRRSSS